MLFEIFELPSASFKKSLFLLFQQQHCLQCVHMIKTTYQLQVTYYPYNHYDIDIQEWVNGCRTNATTNSCFENLLSFCICSYIGTII